MTKISMNGIICEPQELEISESADHHDRTVYCLTRGQSLGLVFVAEAGLFSLISVLVLFVLIVKNLRRARRLGSERQHLLQQPMDVYLVSLFLAELLQGLAAVFEFRWIFDGKVQSGSFCSAQGLLVNIGSTVIALSTLVIAVHTFVTVWTCIRWRSLVIPSLVVATLWAYPVIYAVVMLSTQKNPYYLPNLYWCWIAPHFGFHQFTAHLLWVWCASVFSLLLYIPLFFWSRGNITVRSNDPWWKFHIHGRKIQDPLSTKRLSYTMILYAVTYCILVFPLVIAGIVQCTLGTDPLPSVVWISVVSLYNLSGFVNVLLFLFTRSGLLLFSPTTAQVPVSTIGSLSGLEHETLRVQRGVEQTRDPGLPSRRVRV